MAKTAHSGTAEMVRQFLTGSDFESPTRMLADITSEQAVIVPGGFPYSIGDQVGHSLFWQNRWLGRIQDRPLEKKKGRHGDWQRVTAEQWDSVRAAFLAGLDEMDAIADDEEELARRLWNGETVEALIHMIVLHNTYHLGQISLLRQMLHIWPPAGGDDSW
jgi:uncharacterized damage-inducible protein DinB